MDTTSHILIVKQDEPVSSALTNLFQKGEFQCTVVRDGGEAIQNLEANRYDLMVADIQMPGNQDLEFIHAAQQVAKGMPVILCVAIASNQQPVAAFLVKPVEMDELTQQVKPGSANLHTFKRAWTAREGSHAGQDEEAQIDLLIGAIEETIQVLESTRSSFKSKKLGALRKKLERLLAAE